MRIILTSLIIVLCTILHGQYIVTTNAKCIAALEEKSQNGDPSLKAAINFIETAKKGNYKQWNSMLSNAYRISDPQGRKNHEWWSYLSTNNIQYEMIAEQPAKTRGNKIVYFKQKTNNENKKLLKIILLKENDQWKVQSVEL